MYQPSLAVCALFCIVIISGAIRAIRHPERYRRHGPRSADAATFGGAPSFQNNSFNPMQSNPTGFNPIQSNPTGFNPGFGQSPFGSGSYSVQAPPPPPPPPAPARPPVDTNPANIFAQMKSGTFAADESMPQPQDKYDALRPNPTPLTVQPTGWGGFGNMNGYQGGGYGYQR
ncbi:hypothetical protein NUW54_g3073 [Trametes sanguinea]|uniref:Uncharacterized protein n=1 Tax=Trametes sanguinea TaxID=158606 RepID=A0ACC1Q1R8_9APHY|nr:hypothetical protein NUW54_g3073 [Trametes sanguinea]